MRLFKAVAWIACF